MKKNNKNKRNKEIIVTSIIGIITNFFLAIFKAIVGILSGSIAIVLDAINNTTDVASSVVTIIGAKLATKKPDKEHPFGHGRIEYLSSLVISVIILYAGLTAFTESIKKIIHPTLPNYTIFTIIVVVVATFVKIILGNYVKVKGKELSSSSLINSGNDALLDAVVSFTTLVSAFIYIVFKISTEAYLSIIISIIILKTGLDMLKEAISSILGERVDKNLIKEVRKTIYSYEEVYGVYDMIFSNYGPTSYTGSVHIEIPNTMDLLEVDELQRKITSDVYQKHGILLTAIGIYAIDKKNKRVIEARHKIKDIIKEYDTILQMHGFYFNTEKKLIQFDLVVSFDEKNQDELHDKIYNEVKKLYPDYKLIIQLDNDFSVSI